MGFIVVYINVYNVQLHSTCFQLYSMLKLKE